MIDNELLFILLLFNLHTFSFVSMCMSTCLIAFQRNEKGETPLHRACIEGNLKKVQKLIEQVGLLVVFYIFEKQKTKLISDNKQLRRGC